MVWPVSSQNGGISIRKSHLAVTKQFSKVAKIEKNPKEKGSGRPTGAFFFSLVSNFL
jgi:hypothetical protein